MRSDFQDLTGMKFGKLTVIKMTDNTKWNDHWWLCKCDCGSFKEIAGHSLKSGNSKTCGCFVKEARPHRKKGYDVNSRLYKVWSNMKSRCNNPNSGQYKWYGERGIAVCDEWNEYKPFMEWAISNGYSENLELDRINNNGNYEPSNCRFITHKENCNNRRSCKNVQNTLQKIN